MVGIRGEERISIPQVCLVTLPPSWNVYSVGRIAAAFDRHSRSLEEKQRSREAERESREGCELVLREQRIAKQPFLT